MNYNDTVYKLIYLNIPFERQCFIDHNLIKINEIKINNKLILQFNDNELIGILEPPDDLVPIDKDLTLESLIVLYT